MRKRNPNSGRRRKPTRYLLNLLEKKDGKRRHVFSVIVDASPNELMKIMQELRTKYPCSKD